MAIHLHEEVDLAALDKIEQERPKSDERLIYCMHTWLQRDCGASWEKVVSSLRKTRRNDLAKQIQSRYCTPSQLQRSRSPPSPSPAEIFPSCTQQLPKREPAQPRSTDVAEGGGVVTGIAVESSRLEEHFVSVVTQANIYFSEREDGSPRFLNWFRITLTKLPLCKKYEHMHFLKEEKDRFKAAHDVSEIFDILDPYWNYFDYKLLEHIITQFGDDTLKQAMHEYVSDLERFEKETSIQDYIDATCSCREIPPELHTVIIEMDKKASECTLYDIRQFKESLANRSLLSAYTMYLKKVGKGSVIVTLAFPKDALGVVIEGLLEATFLDAHAIISVSIPDIPKEEKSEFNSQELGPVSNTEVFNVSLERPIFYYPQTSTTSNLSTLSGDSGMPVSVPLLPLGLSRIGQRLDQLSPYEPSHSSRHSQHSHKTHSNQHTDHSTRTTDSGYLSHRSEQSVWSDRSLLSNESDFPILLKSPAKVKSQRMSNLLVPITITVRRTKSPSSHGSHISHHSAASHTFVAPDGSIVTETLC